MCSPYVLHTAVFYYGRLSPFLLSGTFSRYFTQLTPGEGHGRLRRVDSNRKSRSFSKQPSTGDYYKTLSSDSAEPRGSRAMAPNEEVTRPALRWLSHRCGHLIHLLHRSDRFPRWLRSRSRHRLFRVYVRDVTQLLHTPAATSCKLPPHFHGFLHLHPVLSTVWSLQSRPRGPNQRVQLPSCSGFTGVRVL